MKLCCEEEFPVARRERRVERESASQGREIQKSGEGGREDRREEREGEWRVRRRLWEGRENPSLLTRYRSGGERRREEREQERALRGTSQGLFICELL